jgi:hypothetical protein
MSIATTTKKEVKKSKLIKCLCLAIDNNDL